MGSVEEERLVQMVHDFIESESTTAVPLLISPHRHYSNVSSPLNNQPQYFTLQEILGRRTKTEVEIVERVLKYTSDKKEGAKFPSQKKYLVMRLQMDGYNASLCHTSWPTSFGCPAGDYEYIEILIMEGENNKNDGNGKSERGRVMVDIDFKSQFELARPTSAYKQLTSALPQIFVGSEDKLIQIISLLCSAAKQSLKERGLHVPPWRTAAYMQSKWLSPAKEETSNTNAKDTKISAEDNNGHTKNFITKWAPPAPIVVKPNKTRDLGGGSGLSSQFSNMRINCC
ncbi:uncharacterized protein LOC133802576 [Humulus lupulus]|uniref:uncharacterized protein LOC133802576 n=1 Tax=Humulus lupulus TaxID=3486 RepID=UPI002B40DBAA|nr:uncharacterized protein LOC133802576 [Humulus lupulus]